MTMNYERRNAVNRTRELLVDLLAYRYENVSDDLWQEVRRCLKHYPGDYDMERAADMAPEIFGDFEWYTEQRGTVENNESLELELEVEYWKQKALQRLTEE